MSADGLKKFFKAIPDAYYNWRKRNEKIDLLLSNYSNTLDSINQISKEVGTIKEHVSNLEANMASMVTRIEVVKEGMKSELFKTLQNWREMLVVRKGWATIQDKRDVENIYSIYSGAELRGNGNGYRYYQEIMALPESKEEMEAKKGV